MRNAALKKLKRLELSRKEKKRRNARREKVCCMSLQSQWMSPRLLKRTNQLNKQSEVPTKPSDVIGHAFMVQTKRTLTNNQLTKST